MMTQDEFETYLDDPANVPPEMWGFVWFDFVVTTDKGIECPLWKVTQRKEESELQELRRLIREERAIRAARVAAIATLVEAGLPLTEDNIVHLMY